MPSSSDRPRSGVGEGQEREFGRRIKSRMVQLVPYRNARPPARRSPLMQALHARRGSITSEHRRGFVREFGRRAIARRWEKWPHSMMQRGPVDKGEQDSCKLEEGDTSLLLILLLVVSPSCLGLLGRRGDRLEPTATATAAVATAAAPAMSVGLIMHTRLLCDGLRASTTNARKGR